MQVRPWLNNLAEIGGEDDSYRLRLILKSGNELVVTWVPSNDTYGTDEELSDGDYMIDTRSVAAIEFLETLT